MDNSDFLCSFDTPPQSPSPSPFLFPVGCSMAHAIHQCCGSGMFIPDSRSQCFPSWIPDPNSFHHGMDPGSASRNLIILAQKYWKYDLGCSSRIRILSFYPSRIPDPGFKKAPDPGSATLPNHCRFIHSSIRRSWRPTPSPAARPAIAYRL